MPIFTLSSSQDLYFPVLFLSQEEQDTLTILIHLSAIILMVSLVIFIKNKMIKRKADKNKPPHASILFLQKANFLNERFSDTISLSQLNHKPVDYFSHQGRTAVYLRPGENHLQAQASWLVGKNTSSQTQMKDLVIFAKADTTYTLYYYIPTGNYHLIEGVYMETPEWEKQLDTNSIVH